MESTSTRSTFDFSQRLYEFWLQYSDNFQAIEQCIEQYLPTAIQKLYPRLDNKNFNILSVGAGNGQNDLRILTEVIGCLIKDERREIIEVCNTAIEPNTIHIQEYTTLIQGKAQDFSKTFIQFQFENKTFEEYQKSEHERNRFDLIQAVQSLRFLEDPKSALKYCYDNELKNNGCIAYVISTGNPNEVFHLVGSILDEHKSLYQRENAHWQPSTELAAHVTSNYERFPFYSILDVTDILDEKSQNWRLVLDAVTCTEDFCRKADKRVIDEVCEVVKEVACTNNKGRLVVGIENELAVLYKHS